MRTTSSRLLIRHLPVATHEIQIRLVEHLALVEIHQPHSFSRLHQILRRCGVDLLIHECYFPDGYEELAIKTGHSCLSPVLEVARAAQVKRLVLIHVNPLASDDDPLGLDLLGDAGLPVSIAYDLQRIEF